jgi:hypothetical protein
MGSETLSPGGSWFSWVVWLLAHFGCRLGSIDWEWNWLLIPLHFEGIWVVLSV